MEPRLLLIHYLRERCGFRAANVGCDTTGPAAAAEQALAGGASVADAAALAAEGTDPAEDIHADRAYRQHLARVHDAPHAIAVAGTSRNAPVSYKM